MILDRPWMKKHKVLLDIINDYISFSPKYCLHPRAFLVLVPTMPIDDFLPNRILKRGSAERINDFLKISEKISDKKRQLSNPSKQKLALQKRKPETLVISILDNSDKKDIPIPSRSPKIGTKEIDITLIGTDAYYAAYRLTGAQLFAVSIRDLEYQAEKEARQKIDPRSVVREEYHDLLHIFSKKNSDTLFPHQNYDYKIILKKQ